MKTLFLTGIGLTLGFALSGCTGPTAEGDDWEEYCAKYEHINVIPSPDDVSEFLGFSVNQIMGSLKLPVTATAYHPDEKGLTGTLPKEDSPTDITLEVEYNGGEIREKLYSGDPGGYCSDLDHVEVDVEISVKTADGLLDETWDGIMRIDNDNLGDDNSKIDFRNNIRLNATFDPGEFNGLMQIDNYCEEGYLSTNLFTEGKDSGGQIVVTYGSPGSSSNQDPTVSYISDPTRNYFLYIWGDLGEWESEFK